MSLFCTTSPKYRLIAFFLCLALAAHNGYAEGEQTRASSNNKKQEPLSITLSAQKVQKSADGKETLSKADKVAPDDLLEYSAVYRNRSKDSISGLNASLPIPFGMTYVAKSARPESVLASVDGVKFEAEPLMRTVKDKDGKEQQIAVPYSEYRNLRWAIGTMEGGKRLEVSARMRVNQLPKSPEELVKKPAVPVTKQ